MKFRFLLLLVLILQNVSAQSVDSTAIKQVDSLIKVSRDFTAKNDFQNALEINAIAEKLAIDHSGSWSYLNSKTNFNKGRIYFLNSEFSKATKSFLESLLILEKNLNAPSLDIVKTLNKLGEVYRIQGLYKNAESYLFKSLDLQERIPEKNLEDFADCLSNLGILFFELGQFENAELYYTRALLTREKLVGKSHPLYATTLICLANLYSTLANYEKSEQLYLKAKEIYINNQTVKNLDYALLLNNMGILYFNLNAFEKSETFYLEAISIYRDLLGNENPEYAMSINNLAALYFKMRKLNKAEFYFKEANSIWLKVYGEEHPHFLTSQNNLAAIYFEEGDYLKAKVILQRTNTIYKKILGNMHPDYVFNLDNLVSVYWFTKDFDTVKVYLTEAINAEKTLLFQASSFLSEIELSKYIQNFLTKQHTVLSINKESKNLNEICFDNVLYYKGFILNARAQFNKLIKLNTTNNEKLELWKTCNQNLAKIYASKIADVDRSQFVSLLEITNTLEKELVQSIKEFKNTTLQVYWQDVQTKLKKNEAALEFVTYNLSDSENTTDSIMYAALLVKPGESQVFFIPLFDEKSLDSLLQFNTERKADYVNNLYSIAHRGAIAIESPKKTLYEMIWQPIEKYREGIKTIYFSPSGLLHRINLDAIPINETEILADRYKLIELNSTRQLVIPTTIKNVNNDAVLYGGIQYEQESMFQNYEPLMASRSKGELSFSAVDTTLRGGNWNYLAGTEREVSAIEKIMQTNGVQTKLKKGYAATEGSFKNIGANNNPSPRILHIATHGYFFADPKESHQSSVISRQEEIVFKMSEHPMLRSGLIMAGGNAAWQGKQTLEGREDGILTAYEISQMNLLNTELVVLSACETGLGDIQGNEGVYGLQRAFKIAGAKYLIMSLWQVPDKQTSLLMTTFYKKWLEDKMTIPDAFHAAQKELREIGLDPYQWAGFVLVE